MEYLKDVYDVNATIVFDETLNNFDNDSDERVKDGIFNGVKLIDISLEGNLNKRGTLKAYKEFIRKNAKNIDLLLVFHAKPSEVKFCNYYKKINKNGRVMTILDYSKQMVGFRGKSIFSKLKHNFEMLIYYFDYLKFKKTCDEFSVETKTNFEFLKKHRWNGLNISKKLELLPFGFDKKDFCYRENEKFEKENIFLSIGRVGSYKKNTEIILKALEKVDLKDWKFMFIGPIEESFNEKIDNFYEKCPEKHRSVIFVGEIRDKKILAEYYKKSRVFVSSSRFESFSSVLVEAVTFQNYLISTPTGGARDLIEDGSGDLFENSDNLLVEIQMIVDGKTKLQPELSKEISKKYDYKKLVSNFEFFKNTLS